MSHVILLPTAANKHLRAQRKVELSLVFRKATAVTVKTSQHSWWVCEYSTCQHMCGNFLSRIYWVSGEGSSSYLSKGSLSITMGSQSTQEKRTTGWAERGGWQQEMEMVGHSNLRYRIMCYLYRSEGFDLRQQEKQERLKNKEAR